MAVSQHFPNYFGRFAVGARSQITPVKQGVEYPPLDWFQAVTGIRQGPVLYHKQAILPVVLSKYFVEFYWLDWPGLAKVKG
jgi:hypothetical protein